MTDFQRLEEIKKILGLSYNKMADVLGLKNAQTFYDIKAGKCGISFDVASKFQEYFKKTLNQNLNINWLINESGSMFLEDTTAQSFHEASNMESNEIEELKRKLAEAQRKLADQDETIKTQANTIKTQADMMQMMMAGNKICG